jgi:hypothetical protein
MPIIKARSSSIIDSVDLRGQPTAATAAAGTSTTQIASTGFVRQAVADLIASAPSVLDTLNELAAALGNDANFATTVTTALAGKVALAGDTMTGFLTLSADPQQNLHAATKKYVDDAINAQMIYSTDDVDEGTTNLYFTTSRARNAVTLSSDNTSVLSYNSTTGQFTYTHPTSDGILEGTTNLYYTTNRVHNAISLNSDDNQILSYGSGAFTFTTPDTDKIVEGSINKYFTTARARASISNGSNISYDSSSGVISTQAAVWSVNSQTHDVVLDTDDINEGSANQYFTNARAAGAISLTSNDTNILSYSNGAFTFNKPNSDAVAEGSSNLYFTATRVRESLSASGDISYNEETGDFSYSTPTTDGVNEGASNLYFTNTRARNAVSLNTDNSSVLDYDSTTGVFTFTLGNQTTTDVAEGSNLYFTDARARDAIDVAGWSNLSYNSGTGVITISAPSTDDVTEGSALYFTNTRARDAVSATKVSGDGAFSYDNTTGTFSYTGPDDADYRTAVSAVKDSGHGNFQYNSTTGVFTYTGPTNTNYRAAVSATKVSGDGDLSYDSATGVFSYTGPSASEVRAHLDAATSGVGHGDLTYDNSTGIFTFAKVTAADVRGDVSASTSGTGHGGFSYDSATGVFTYAKVTAAEVRGDISATTATGVSYNSTTGVISLSGIPNSSLTNSDVTVNGYTIALGGSATLNADDVAEAVGGTNKYFTEARFDASLATKTTSDVAEGSNLYYTQARFNTAFGAKTTSDLAEGTNKYFTTARARDSLSSGTGVTYTSSTGVIAIGQDVSTTSNVTFGDVTVSGDLTVNGTMTAVNSTTVTIADKNLTLASGAANAAAANGAGITIEGAGAEFFYSSGDDRWNVNKSVNVTGGVTVTTTVTATNGFVGDLTGDVTGDLFGNADTATKLATARNIQGVAFDGTGNITVVTAGTGVTVTGTEVKIGQAVGTTDNVTFNTVTADLTGDVTGNLTGNVTGQVSDISNHTTDALTEGTTNLYATPARVRSAISAVDAGGDGSFSFDSTSGAFTYTGPSASETRAHFSAGTSGTGFGGLSYNSSTGAFTFAKVTSADIRGEVSANKTGGDGNFSYDSTTGTFSYTGPDQDDYRLAISATKVSGDGSISYDDATGVISYTGPSAADTRAHFSATSNTGITYTSSTGIFALASIPNSSLSNSSITINGANIALGSSDTLDTDDIGEGTTNQYFTNARARNAISLTTSDSTVLSYDSSTGAFAFSLAGIDTDEVTEGTTNLYFTTQRARDSVSATGDLSYNDATGVFGYTTPNSDGIVEGSSNLYFTNSRARQSISLTTDNSDALSYDSTTGEFSFTLNSVKTDEIAEGTSNLYFTTARARNTVSNGANIDYDASTGVISTQAAVWSVNGQNHAVVLDTDNVDEGSENLYFTDARAAGAITLVTDDSSILSYATGTGTFTFVTPTTDSISEGETNLYYTDARADGRIAAASVFDLADVDNNGTLNDGYSLVWNSALQKFMAQNVAVTVTTLNFTGDGTTTSFNTEVEINTINDVQVFINGLVQAPTYSFTIDTVNGETSIIFDAAPEANDYIMIRATPTAQLSAGGILNENSMIDGGTY